MRNKALLPSCALLFGCLSADMRIEDLKYKTQSATGCQRELVEIKDEQFSPQLTWTAICEGKQYACFTTPGSSSSTGPISQSKVICEAQE